jgi:hypothetical protein
MRRVVNPPGPDLTTLHPAKTAAPLICGRAGILPAIGNRRYSDPGRAECADWQSAAPPSENRNCRECSETEDWPSDISPISPPNRRRAATDKAEHGNNRVDIGNVRIFCADSVTGLCRSPVRADLRDSKSPASVRQGSRPELSS